MTVQEYLKIFVDSEYPHFLDKYLHVPTLNRIRHITQFCGSDYTKLYAPRFTFTRYDHSLVVAHMTWHFTHDKTATIAALLHDAATPCFAHVIDHALGDRINQESSEKDLSDILATDEELLKYLDMDEITLGDLSDLKRYPILENKSPKLCTDRLDGVLHTTYIWLNRGTLEDVKRIYDDLTVLINEDGKPEIGFRSLKVALKFASIVGIDEITKVKIYDKV